MHVDKNNNPIPIADRAFSLRCPHCAATVSVSLVGPPRYEYLYRFRPERVGVTYRCDGCNEPIFLVFRVASYGLVVQLDPTYEEVQRPGESYEFDDLPSEVKKDFREALTCYSAMCWNAFAAMCRRTVQSAAAELGVEGTAKVQAQVQDLKEMGLIDEEGFEQFRSILISGHDGAHPHLPRLDQGRARVLLELMKDALHQLFVRPAKIKKAAKLRADAKTDGPTEKR